MKLLPSSPWAYLRPLIALVVVLLGVVAFTRIDRVALYLLSDKQEGDILMQSLPRGELVDAIESVSGSPWSHCGILVKKNGEWMVAQALMDVHYTPLLEYLVQGRDLRVTAYRVPNLTDTQRAKIQPGIARLLGKPYDIEYEPTDRKIYCSELIWKVYDRELGIWVGEWESLGSLNWKSAEAMIRVVGKGAIPADMLMITPVGLIKTGQVAQVFAN